MAAKTEVPKAPACAAEVDRRIAEYKRLMEVKAYWAAASEIRACAVVLGRDDVKAMIKEAEVKSHLADINNPKTPLRERARAMEMLARDYPEIGKKYEAQAAELLKRAEAQEAKALAAKKRSEGVRIGMSEADVLASNWGRPRKVNRTTTALGVSEQWVYDGGYLYFRNGVLETIQN